MNVSRLLETTTISFLTWWLQTICVVLVAYTCMDLRELALPGGFLLLLLSASTQLPFFIYLCNYLDGDTSITIQVGPAGQCNAYYAAHYAYRADSHENRHLQLLAYKALLPAPYISLFAISCNDSNSVCLPCLAANTDPTDCQLVCNVAIRNDHLLWAVEEGEAAS